MKAHLGTDYAAPTGTPIVAVGDGTVSKSSFTSGNGKFVKIRHNSTYETQYLHMSKRAVKVGDVVRQGDVIGYVGSTGLATGPHVCFRFWKNGVQVDHRKEKFPPSLPIKDDLKEDFNTLAQGLNVELETIEWPIDTTHVIP
jgi:murein DD-endopeptidase MepM/ murein hydrolase activator NlpD